ncbi:GNAT family N-acetyltransferase [bacterium]|nr:GNAT family N-acetyltransferase [bacterium]
MENANYETAVLNSKLYKIFAGVYNDFRSVASSDYMFELDPLEYQDFIDAIDKDYVKCIVLLENHIPTAFLVYTTAISESIELNVIHCLGNEDLLAKRKLLIERFLQETEKERSEKVVCYPLLGVQSGFTSDIAHYGFKFVGLAVLRFMMNNKNSEEVLNSVAQEPQDESYKITTWENMYYDKAVEVIHEGFKTASDALFDTRYLTKEGTDDILDKIVNGVYGEFLPETTSVLMHNGRPCGFCFTNITGGKIANIPLVSISKEHQGKGLAKHLIKKSVSNILKMVHSGERDFTEVNVSAETNNIPALKMYRHIGFKEDYSYPQAYLPIK